VDKHPKLEREYLKLELGNTLLNTKQKEAIASIRLVWID
jgi:hypothetical protein